VLPPVAPSEPVIWATTPLRSATRTAARSMLVRKAACSSFHVVSALQRTHEELGVAGLFLLATMERSRNHASNVAILSCCQHLMTRGSHASGRGYAPSAACITSSFSVRTRDGRALDLSASRRRAPPRARPRCASQPGGLPHRSALSVCQSVGLLVGRGVARALHQQVASHAGRNAKSEEERGARACIYMHKIYPAPARRTTHAVHAYMPCAPVHQHAVHG
jgi:hypothetical protein